MIDVDSPIGHPGFFVTVLHEDEAPDGDGLTAFFCGWTDFLGGLGMETGGPVGLNGLHQWVCWEEDPPGAERIAAARKAITERLQAQPCVLACDLGPVEDEGEERDVLDAFLYAPDPRTAPVLPGHERWVRARDGT